MNYALFPFPTRDEHSNASRSDIRHAIGSRNRNVAPNAIDNLELLDCLVESLRDMPWRFVVDHCHENDGKLHVAVFATDLGKDLELGDKINAGFFLQNSENSKPSTLACNRLFRVACANGALTECDQEQSFEISEVSNPPGDWKQKIHEVVCRSFDTEHLDVDLARFRATTQQMIVTPYEFLCHLSAQGLIDDDEQSDIQAAFTEEAEFSMYGLINAVTQVAHRLRSDDRWIRAFQMERLGGEILRGDHNLSTFSFAYS